MARAQLSAKPEVHVIKIKCPYSNPFCVSKSKCPIPVITLCMGRSTSQAITKQACPAAMPCTEALRSVRGYSVYASRHAPIYLTPKITAWGIHYQIWGPHPGQRKNTGSLCGDLHVCQLPVDPRPEITLGLVVLWKEHDPV
jgi:hypothetical protein